MAIKYYAGQDVKGTLNVAGVAVFESNVGIGTTTPNTALQVNQSTTVPLLVHRPSNTNFDPHGIGFSTRSDALNGGLGDVRSGIFSDYNGDLFLAADTTSITTDPLASSRLFIEGNNGYVGIGTTTPTAPLDVFGVRAGRDWSINNRATIRLDANGTGFPSDILFGHTEAANQTSWTGAYWSLSSRGSSADNKFYFYRGAGNPDGSGESIIMTFDPNQYVGIGTTSPDFKLDVQASGNVARFGDGTRFFRVYTDSDEVSLLADGSVPMKFYTGGSEKMRITSAGGISFGSTGTAYGTSGQVLTSAGNASPTWTTPTTGTVTGSGTAEYIPKWNSTSALVNSKAFQSTASSITTFNIGTAALTCDFLNFPDVTGAITGKVPVIEAKAALIGIGARDKTYTTIYEGIKIIPATSHYLTRITPRLEVYPYEDPSTTTDNTYDSSFVGSCFSMGSQNTIGDSTSSNLGIFGFNNTITGDKFVIIGQGNVMGKANVSSLAVGTTNTISGNGKLVNSLLVGQNMTLTQAATRSIVAGINHSFQGAMNNTVIVGSGNQGFGSNNFIWGSSNQGSGVNNIMLGGFSGQITSSSGNLYGSALMGWNNTLQTSPRATFVTGRDNVVIDTDYSIIGGYNNDADGNNYSLLVGTKNYGRGSGNIIGGESNTVENTSSNNNLIGGFGNTVSSLSNLVVGTNNNVKSTTKGNIVGGNNNNIDVAANENNIISGIGNDIFVGSDNIVAGNGNNVGILSNTSSKIARSIIVGQNNSVGTYSASGVAAKSNMAIFGSSNSARGQNAFVAGSNNSCYTDNAIVLGNGNSAGGVSAGESKVIQIGFSIQPNSQSDYLAIGYGMSALPTTAVDNNNVANKYTAIGRNPDNNVDYDLSSLDPVSFIVGAGTQQNFRRTAIAVTCKNASGDESNVILPGVGKYRNYTNDTTAAAGGVPLYGLYHTSGTIKIRIA